MAEKRFADAVAYFDTALAIVRAELISTPDNRFGFSSTVEAHRAIALASRGDREEASRVLKPIEPFLIASDQGALLARCRDAIRRTDDHAASESATHTVRQE